MQTFQLEDTPGEWPPELCAALESVEGVLTPYKWTPFPLVGKSRRDLATQCAAAALVAVGHDLGSPDD